MAAADVAVPAESLEVLSQSKCVHHALPLLLHQVVALVGQRGHVHRIAVWVWQPR
eukprot:CAMPEP_0178418000 /NCGR_PEP_ID=MMETSP0689_2-20121128/24862_1 /TAXON_ID=160604 /ORGANISM="Amphidinium massartii, Strain CS-259" /LENGTH=54 /DNA_ID=CAMNT_0020039379 /DNA_START=208 /DNA_END=372 /DNA_ORIENTATION=-